MTHTTDFLAINSIIFLLALFILAGLSFVLVCGQVFDALCYGLGYWLMPLGRALGACL
jgi:hypothetical protein